MTLYYYLHFNQKTIKVDSNYAEAYNKRATVNFSLRKANECFMDMDSVLRLEPFHYGALCGKVILLAHNLNLYHLTDALINFYV